jgi:hypothetical protein
MQKNTNLEELNMFYTIQNYSYYVEPVTKAIEEHDTSVTITTWKYDDDQRYFNFEVQFPLEQVKEDFNWESGSYFLGDLGDMIQDITTVVLKDRLLIIGGLKEKGNQ